MKPGYRLQIDIPNSSVTPYLAIYNNSILNTYIQLCLIENSVLFKSKKTDSDFIGIWKPKKIKK